MPVNCYIRPELLFLTHDRSVPPGESQLHALAYEVGFRPVVVPWEHVRIGYGFACAVAGFEQVGPQARRSFICAQPLSPALIFHRMYMVPDREETFRRLARTFPRALLSYDPALKPVSSKWGAELCLREGEKKGIHVERPETYLVRKKEMRAAMRGLGKSLPLIFKPAEGSQGKGIRISTPTSFERVVEGLLDEGNERYVVQRLLEDALKLEGKAFDLRLYVLVQNFRPLRFLICRDGIVRVASREQSQGGEVDPRSVITNCAYRSSCNESVHNRTIPELLGELRADGYDVRNFWESVHALVERLLTCFVRYSRLSDAVHIRRLFLVTDLDLMLKARHGRVEPVFIESNYTPLFHNFGPPRVDEGLERASRSWLAALMQEHKKVGPALGSLREEGSSEPAAGGGHPPFTFQNRGSRHHLWQPSSRSSRPARTASSIGPTLHC